MVKLFATCSNGFRRLGWCNGPSDFRKINDKLAEYEMKLAGSPYLEDGHVLVPVMVESFW